MDIGRVGVSGYMETALGVCMENGIYRMDKERYSKVVGM